MRAGPDQSPSPSRPARGARSHARGDGEPATLSTNVPEEPRWPLSEGAGKNAKPDAHMSGRGIQMDRVKGTSEINSLRLQIRRARVAYGVGPPQRGIAGA